jgi:predicted neuraminidase
MTDMSKPTLSRVLPMLATVIFSAALIAQEPRPASSEFIYDDPPTPSCHASTIVESNGKILAAWFGGKDEGDVSVGIWLAHYADGKWTKPTEVATGRSDDGKKYPCWNPVLFQPKAGPLMLLYKVGPSPSRWWGMLITSTDNGQTWSKPQRLPEGILGPIKDKPIELADGTIVCGSSTEHQGWRLHVELTRDQGKTWTKTEALNDGKEFAAIQPAFLVHGPADLQLLCRSKSGNILTARSKDAGQSWTPLMKTDLPNPNSGIDAVTLKDGLHLVVYNHTRKGRSPLNVAVSKDGQTWTQAITLESQPGEYSYPAVIQSADGNVHITYTWKREKIRHVVLSPEAVRASHR